MSPYLTAVMLFVRQGYDLTARQQAVLGAVVETDAALGVRELAATLNVSKPAITRALDQLEADGLAVRRKHAGDRRLIYVASTAAGRKRWSMVQTVMHNEIKLAATHHVG